MSSAKTVFVCSDWTKCSHFRPGDNDAPTCIHMHRFLRTCRNGQAQLEAVAEYLGCELRLLPAEEKGCAEVNVMGRWEFVPKTLIKERDV